MNAHTHVRALACVRGQVRASVRGRTHVRAQTQIVKNRYRVAKTHRIPCLTGLFWQISHYL